MPSHVSRIAVAAAFLAASTAPLAQQKLDIVQIMGQFVQANYATSKCLKPDQQTLSKFNSNLRTVSTRATEEMLKRKPGATEQQVTESFKSGTQAVEKQINEVVQSKGCGDPRIQDLLKRFEVQANLKL
jgi:hypothetical protein